MPFYLIVTLYYEVGQALYVRVADVLYSVDSSQIILDI